MKIITQDPIECPVIECPCPIKYQAEPEELIIPVGGVISSPGGSYFYEILSAPVKRYYLDFKGLFRRISVIQAKHVSRELGEAAGDNRWESVLWSIFNQHSTGNSGSHISYPTPERLFWIGLWFLLIKNKFPLHLAAHLCWYPMPDLAESFYTQKGKVNEELTIKPISYRVRCWERKAKGSDEVEVIPNYQKVGSNLIPTEYSVRTIRWDFRKAGYFKVEDGKIMQVGQ
ncbi:MAG: hypothetical protein LRZ84_14815 [Desertifilum sp.]|nr:hypothetical protein [Desertifilum sp.]